MSTTKRDGRDDETPSVEAVIFSNEVVVEDPYAVRIVEIPEHKWQRRYRSVAFQMVLLSMLSFSGPSMSNAISGLGGGGLATPYTANAASATQYSTSVLIAMFGGPLISTIGIPIGCIIGAIGFPLSGSGFYVNSKYGVQWYLIFAKAIYGITSAFLYIAEASAMISYPEEHRRGFYISIWVIMRNIGSIIGGAITFGLNISRNGYGGVSANTYLVFLGLECLGLPAAFLMTRTRKVIRSDGWGVPMLPTKTWKQECRLLWEHHRQKRTLMLIPIYILTYFGDGVWGTYNSLHFSVRARALSSFIGPVLAVFINPFFGMILDMKMVNPRRKGTIAFWVWMLPTMAMLIWVMVNLKWFNDQPNDLRLDYAQPTTARWFATWFPYLIYVVNGWMSQTLVYWVLGQFASDVATNARTGGVFRSWETVGQAVSYGINSKASNKFIPFGVYIGLFAVAMPLFWTVLMELPKEHRGLRIVDDEGHVVGEFTKAQQVPGEERVAREIPI
ncbi:Peroxidase [Pleurostoma richardsiae]|uniref:Peroxidase n=1 Tax=Pleurostoma richardsiae TaxID=41990 RepID=A0AA38RAN3_9PEZI|nr:Peroxidase [Pleurostoma richardsiae]